MKEIQVMKRVDASAQTCGKSASKRKQQRKRKRKLRKIRAFVLRAVTILFAAVLLLIVFLGGRFLMRKFSEKIGKDGGFLWDSSSYMEAFEEKGPLVVLDAGHGGKDQGTSSGKLLEKDINLKVAKLVEKELKKKGIRVLLTREDDSRVKLEERAAFANEKKATMFVSIHCNYNEDSSQIKGTEFYYQKGSDDGRAAAEALSSRFDEVQEIVNRGTREEDFYVLRETNMPAVLIELGFFSNASDRRKLNQKSYQELLAENIAETIAESEMAAGVSKEADMEQ